MGMAEGHGAHTHAVFDKFIAVHIPHMGTLAASEINRHRFGILIIALRISVRTTGNDGMEFGLQRFGFRKIHITGYQARPFSLGRFEKIESREWADLSWEFPAIAFTIRLRLGGVDA